jgi:hypothetical protein
MDRTYIIKITPKPPKTQRQIRSQRWRRWKRREELPDLWNPNPSMQRASEDRLLCIFIETERQEALAKNVVKR